MSTPETTLNINIADEIDLIEADWWLAFTDPEKGPLPEDDPDHHEEA